MFLESNYLEIGFMVGIFLALFILGLILPLRKNKYPPWQRLIINFSLTSLVFLIGIFVIKPVDLNLATWTAQQRFGLLYIIKMPLMLKFIIGFLLIDLTFYYWHRLNHTIPLLWRFHIIHHIDPDMDVTTSFRFHFVEILYSTVFRVLQVGLLGISPFTYIVYELIFQISTMFHHSNFALPLRLERVLNKILVTPRMHGIHHSQIKEEMNANYSVIFRLWDHLHKTLRLNIQQSEIEIGVAAYSKSHDNKLWNLLLLPFCKQKNYWQAPDGAKAIRESTTIDKNVMLK